jgi:hypothetical protein
LLADQRWIHTRRDTLFTRLLVGEALTDREQLDHVAGRPRCVDLLLRDGRDALTVDRLDRHDRVEREAGEDGRLLRGVESADVRRRISLCEAEFRGGRESVLKGVAVRVHAIEDEVRGPVDDAQDAIHPVAGQAVPQRADDRDRAADGSLVIELGADLLRGVEKFRPMGRKQRLVCSDDICTRVEGLQYQGARRLDAAHEFDHDVGTQDERLRIRREEVCGKVDVALRVRVTHRDAGEFQARADARGKFLAVFEQELGHLRSDGAGSEKADPQIAVFDHADAPSRNAASRARRSASVSPRTMTRATPSRTAMTGGRPR